MSELVVPDCSTPQARLAALEADPNLSHTAARWHAHEAVYPGSGALAMAERCVAGDLRRIPAVRAAVKDFQAKAPGDVATRYLEWVLTELEDGTVAHA